MTLLMKWLSEDILQQGLNEFERHCELYALKPDQWGFLPISCKSAVLALPLACRLPSTHQKLQSLRDSTSIPARIVHMMAESLTARRVGERGGNKMLSDAVKRIVYHKKHEMRELSILRAMAVSSNPANHRCFDDLSLVFRNNVTSSQHNALDWMGVGVSDKQNRELKRDIAKAGPVLMDARLASSTTALATEYDNYAVIMLKKATTQAKKHSSSDSAHTITNSVVVTTLPLEQVRNAVFIFQLSVVFITFDWSVLFCPHFHFTSASACQICQRLLCPPRKAN
jgi:hypothetical protein